MLRLILGRTGTGKSELVMSRALEAARAGCTVRLLVPEQFSFAAQVRIAKAVRGAAAGNIEVLDFSRLAVSVFRVCGGLTGRRLDDVSRCVIMRLAVQETAERLEFYRRAGRSAAFVASMVDAVGEFKQEGLYPEAVSAAAEGMPDELLAAKLRDIALLYGAYQDILERSFCDPLDDILKAAAMARESGFFVGYTVFVDGFARFGAPESRMLELMLEQADSVTVALACGGEEGGVFSDQEQTARRLSAFAKAAGIPAEPAEELSEIRRFSSPGLRLTEKLCASVRFLPLEPVADANVRIVPAADVYAELRYASAEICRLVREEGLRYRDCAVICRDIEQYRPAAQAVFAEYELPVFMDRKDSIAAKPLVSAILSALEACRGGYKTEAILALSRSPALGIDRAAAGELENYCYIWSVSGADWLRPFENAPEGLTDAPPERYAAELARIEAVRREVMEPLSRLRDSVAGGRAESFCRGIYNFIVDTGALKNISAFDEENGGSQQEGDRVWNCVVDVLDLFCELMPDAKYSTAAFIELFTLALSREELGSVPNTRDQLVFGGANRIRLDNPRAVFVLGLNEGEFPAVSQPSGIFTQRERDALTAGGIELGASGVGRALRERFCLYTSLTCGRERLYLTYHEADLRGEPAKPSAILKRLASLLPGSLAAPEGQTPYFYAATLPAARGVYASLYASGDGRLATMRELLARSGCGRYPADIAAAASRLPSAGITPETARRLTGDRLYLSPTGVETFYQCPYRYFCRNMLRLFPRRRVEYSPLSSGNAIHFVLERLLSRHGGQGLGALPWEELSAEISALLEEYVLAQVTDERQLTPKFRYQMRRLTAVLGFVIRHIAQDFAQSEFEVAAAEAEIGEGKPIAPPEIRASDGTPLRLTGKVDRIDAWNGGSGAFARVVDYKSGNKQFVLSDVMYGLNMQMLIYLFAICDDGNAPGGGGAPAGALYVPGGVKPAESEDEVEKSLRMSGVLLDDEGVLRAMERELEGKYIPVAAKPDGSYKRDSLLTGEELERLRALVYRNISELGDALRSGAIAPLPARDGARNDPCRYCEYSALCNAREGAVYKDISAKGGVPGAQSDQ